MSYKDFSNVPFKENAVFITDAKKFWMDQAQDFLKCACLFLTKNNDDLWSCSRPFSWSSL
jgi:hypothetical protein